MSRELRFCALGRLVRMDLSDLGDDGAESGPYWLWASARDFLSR